jgi:uncharacterized DUF497 family protein
MAQRFAWDERKAEVNRRKHGVTFDEASTVFADPLGLHVVDAVYPARAVLIGMSRARNVILVVHEEESDTTIRIISARRPTTHERRRYEEGV